MTSQILEKRVRNTALDGWRGIALVGVLFDHFVTPHGLNLGRFGVEMFFVLSGTLMAEILFERHTPVPLFFLRRFARIYPSLIVFGTILFAVSFVFPAIEIPAQAYASLVTLTENYVSVLWRRTYPYDHIWSLCVELHMYLTLGAVAALSRRTGWRPAPMIGILIALAILNGMVGTWLFHLKYNPVYWRSDVRGASILIGALTYMILHGRVERFGWIANPLVPVVFAIAALLLNINVVPDPIKYSLGTILLAIAVVTLEGAPAWFRFPFESRLMVAIGTVSYSLYMWQEPFSDVDDKLVRALILPLGLACGVASFYLVEQPARRWISAALRRRRVGEAVEAEVHQSG